MSILECNGPVPGVMIERITNPEDHRIPLVETFLQEHFDPAELDVSGVMGPAIAGRDAATGKACDKYIVIAVQNEQKEIVAVSTGMVLQLLDEDFEPVGKQAMVCGGYTAVSEPYRRQGLASKVFDIKFAEAQKDARERDLTIMGSLGEAHDEAELLLNAKGVRRLYIKQPDGVLLEVPYFQPPLKWDPKTGDPAEGAKSVPEHLTMNLSDGSNSIDGDKLMEYVRGMYNYNNYQFEETFSSKQAFRRHGRILDGITRELERAVSGKEIVMLARAEREQMVGQGVAFIEHSSGS